MNLDFEASGTYFCEVTIDNPIYTKASPEQHIHIIGMWWINFATDAHAPCSQGTHGVDVQMTKIILLYSYKLCNEISCSFSLLCATVKQTGAPKIMFKKRLFVVGEKLIANCTTTRARPAPHITWLINGKKVNLLLQMSSHRHTR